MCVYLSSHVIRRGVDWKRGHINTKLFSFFPFLFSLIFPSLKKDKLNFPGRQNQLGSRHFFLFSWSRDNNVTTLSKNKNRWKIFPPYLEYSRIKKTYSTTGHPAGAAGRAPIDRSKRDRRERARAEYKSPAHIQQRRRMDSILPAHRWRNAVRLLVWTSLHYSAHDSRQASSITAWFFTAECCAPPPGHQTSSTSTGSTTSL